jgi:hypothetical protein
VPRSEDSKDIVPATVAADWSAGGTDEVGGIALQSGEVGAAMTADGIAIIADRMASTVYLINRGVLQRTLGRRGSGPGEFQLPERVGLSGDTLVWISDASLGRITWFDMNGVLVDTWSRPWQQVPRTPWSAQGNWALDGGSVLAVAAPSASTADGSPLPIAIWTSAGDFHVVGWTPPSVPASRRIMTSRSPITGRQPIRGGHLIGAESGGRAFFFLNRLPAGGPQGEITISRYDPAGRVIGEVVIPYESVVVNDSMRAALRVSAQALVEQLPPSFGSVTVKDIIDATWIPERLPPVRDMLADSAGFWLQRELPGIWERYSWVGLLVATARLPDRFRGLTAGADFILGLDIDSLQVPVLTRYRVEIGQKVGDDQ